MEKENSSTAYIVLAIILSIFALGFSAYELKSNTLMSEKTASSTPEVPGLSPSAGALGCPSPSDSVTASVGDKYCLIRDLPPDGTMDHGSYYLGTCAQHPTRNMLGVPSEDRVVTVANMCFVAFRLSESGSMHGLALNCPAGCFGTGAARSTTRTPTSCTVTLTLACLTQPELPKDDPRR